MLVSLAFETFDPDRHDRFHVETLRVHSGQRKDFKLMLHLDYW